MKRSAVLTLNFVTLIGLVVGCSWTGGDYAPLAKEPDTQCSIQAESFCKENLGSADLATCIKREKYRCELLEQEQSEKAAP
jgi:hypothetical protein